MKKLYFSDVDKVHDLMDDVHEQQEIANEIGEAISNPVGFGQDVDEVSEKTQLLLEAQINSSTLLLCCRMNF